MTTSVTQIARAVTQGVEAAQSRDEAITCLAEAVETLTVKIQAPVVAPESEPELFADEVMTAALEDLLHDKVEDTDRTRAERAYQEAVAADIEAATERAATEATEKDPDFEAALDEAATWCEKTPCIFSNASKKIIRFHGCVLGHPGTTGGKQDLDRLILATEDGHHTICITPEAWAEGNVCSYRELRAGMRGVYLLHLQYRRPGKVGVLTIRPERTVRVRVDRIDRWSRQGAPRVCWAKSHGYIDRAAIAATSTPLPTDQESSWQGTMWVHAALLQRGEKRSRRWRQLCEAGVKKASQTAPARDQDICLGGR